MDLRCPRCSEPFEYSRENLEDLLGPLTDEQARAAWARFRTEGCPAVRAQCNPSGLRDERTAAIYEALGDDMDGAAAFLEDLA